MEPQEWEIARMAMRLGNQLKTTRNKAMCDYGLTSAQADSMAFILHRSLKQELTAADLVRRFSLTHQTVTGIVKRLEEKGLIVREASATDARRLRIAPTPEGMRLHEALHENSARNQARMLEGFTQEDRETFKRLLQAAIENLASKK